MFKFDHATAKGLLADIITEGEAIVASGDLAQQRAGRVMHIIGSIVLTILEGVGADGWNKLHDQAASDLSPSPKADKLADGDLADGGFATGARFSTRPGDGPTGSQGLAPAPGTDDGTATGATGDAGTRTNAGSTGDGNTSGNTGDASAGENAANAGSNTGGVA